MASFPFISSITKRGRAGRTGMIEWKGALNGKPNAKLHGLLTLVLLFLGLYCFMSNHFTLLIANQLFFGKLLRKSDMQTENGVVTARQTRLESFRFFFLRRENHQQSSRWFFESDQVLIKMNYTVAFFLWFFGSGFIRIERNEFLWTDWVNWNNHKFSSTTKRNGKLLTRQTPSEQKIKINNK